MASRFFFITIIGSLAASVTASNSVAELAMCIGVQTQGGYNVDMIFKNVAQGSIDSLCSSFKSQWKQQGGYSRNNPINCFADKSKGEWGFGVSTDGANLELPLKVFQDAYQGTVDRQSLRHCVDVPNQSNKRSMVSERRGHEKREIQGDSPIEPGDIWKIFSGQSLTVEGIGAEKEAGQTDYGNLGETISVAGRQFGNVMGSLGKSFALVESLPLDTSQPGRTVKIEAGFDAAINDQHLDIRGEDWFKIISALYFKGKDVNQETRSNFRSWRLRFGSAGLVVCVLTITFDFTG